MEFYFARSARKHHIGRGAVREAMRDAGEPVEQPDGKLLWIGTDDRGRELEIVAVELPEERAILVIHATPRVFRKVR
jgi:hypothetical protein